MEAPEGFTVDLLAAEPDLTQPIAMGFDSLGRLWVIEGHSYPLRRPEGEGLDRILVFSGSDGDASFDTREVFAEGINLASGIALYLADAFPSEYRGGAFFHNLTFCRRRAGDRSSRQRGDRECI